MISFLSFPLNWLYLGDVRCIDGFWEYQIEYEGKFCEERPKKVQKSFDLNA